MLFSTRAALNVLLALTASLAARAYSSENLLEARNYEDLLQARDLVLSSYPQRRSFDLSDSMYSRSFGDDFVLSARDLNSLGIRSSDITHVLVARARSGAGSPKSSPPPSDDIAGRIQWHETQRDTIKAQMDTHLANKKAARRAGDRPAADQHHQKWQDAKENHDYHVDEIHGLKGHV